MKIPEITKRDYREINHMLIYFLICELRVFSFEKASHKMESFSRKT